MPAALQIGTDFAEHLRAREPLYFRHSLLDEPALELESIAELADQLGVESVVREAAVKPLVYADGATEPTREESPGDAVRQLDGNNAWLTLLNIENHSRYRALIDEQLDAAALAAGLPPSDWRNRMGFVFASSPNSVTGAHFDIEHSLLLQLRGRRTLTFGDFPDTETRESEVRRYWSGGSYGKLAALPVPRREVAVEPGVGVYIPPYTPHWLQNGDSASLSLTITFFNRDNESESLVQVCNERLRRFGVDPRPYGRSPLADRVKAGAMRFGSAVTRRRFR